MSAKTAAVSRKPRSQGQRAFNRDFRGTPMAPSQRTAAAVLPPLTPAERAQEMIEEKRMNADWRERRGNGDGFRGA